MLENLFLFFLDLDFKKDLSKKNPIIFESKISSIQKKISDTKEIDWKSSLVFSLENSSIVWEKNKNKKVYFASLAKLMTALLIVENHKLDESVKISKNAENIPGSQLHLLSGEIFSVWDLIKWLLIKSWNDSAVALAEHSSWNVKDFVKKMNQRAISLWLKDTVFKNPTWLDEDWQTSTAYDLAILAEFILKNKFIKKIANTKKTKIYSKKALREVKINSTNYLLWHRNVFWLKTWTTKKAGQCLITLIKKDWKSYLFILLGSNNRFQETRKLMNFVFSKI